ncbi:MAG: hypothetical protein KA099_01030 [Alphaproteobacteria bacterium]|nr:hypothetical protein [Alphaproteobacteria bacterium]MBP7758365.1 hypothetical protein [Alphaproteobacteria bacterium]MBP7762360.1 hypothetical protein [Alphaproteobacteria bacterium]MBP7903883.1 hypothetical protein [Alphaproteobacteria bacterium]
MDEILKRLQETAQSCAQTYEEWRGKKTDSKAQESLQSAIHELRKVASRLEIELAVRERQDIANKPIPIPSHRSSKESVPDGDDDQQDFQSPQHHQRSSHDSHGQKRRRPPHRSAEQGQGSAN